MVGRTPEGGQPWRRSTHAHPYTPRMRKRHLLIEIAQTVALTVIAFYLLQAIFTAFLLLCNRFQQLLLAFRC